MKGWYSSTKEDHNMRWTHGLPNVMTNYCCYEGRMVQKNMNITVIFEESRRTIIWGGLKTYVYRMLWRKGHRTDYDTKWITGLMTYEENMVQKMYFLKFSSKYQGGPHYEVLRNCYEERPTYDLQNHTADVSAQVMVTVKKRIGRVRSITFRHRHWFQVGVRMAFVTWMVGFDGCGNFSLASKYWR